MNRILITGGTGLLGSNLALQLRTNNEVYILSNKKKIHIPRTKTNTLKQSVEHIFSSFKNSELNKSSILHSLFTLLQLFTTKLIS